MCACGSGVLTKCVCVLVCACGGVGGGGRGVVVGGVVGGVGNGVGNGVGYGVDDGGGDSDEDDVDCTTPTLAFVEVLLTSFDFPIHDFVCAISSVFLSISSSTDVDCMTVLLVIVSSLVVFDDSEDTNDDFFVGVDHMAFIP